MMHTSLLQGVYPVQVRHQFWGNVILGRWHYLHVTPLIRVWGDGCISQDTPQIFYNILIANKCIFYDAGTAVHGPLFSNLIEDRITDHLVSFRLIKHATNKISHFTMSLEFGPIIYRQTSDVNYNKYWTNLSSLFTGLNLSPSLCYSTSTKQYQLLFQGHRLTECPVLSNQPDLLDLKHSNVLTHQNVSLSQIYLTR